MSNIQNNLIHIQTDDKYIEPLSNKRKCLEIENKNDESQNDISNTKIKLSVEQNINDLSTQIKPYMEQNINMINMINMTNDEKGKFYEVYINTYVNTLPETKISYLWKDVPEQVLY